MDKKEARTSWIIAGVLAILLVIAVIFWMNAQKDLDTVLRDGYEDIGALRDQIALDCNATDDASQKRCQEHLDDLSQVLDEFSKDLEDATPPAEDTTPQEPTPQ